MFVRSAGFRRRNANQSCPNYFKAISKEERRMKVRKIVAGLAAVSMLAAFSAQVVAAADTVTVTASKVEAKAGEEVTLNIDLADVPAAGISVAEFAIKYDSSVLTDVTVEAGAIANTGVDSAEPIEGLTAFYTTVSDGVVYVNYSTGLTDSKYYITQGGTFAVVKAKVAAGAKADTYPVEIVAIDRADYQGATASTNTVKFGVFNADMTESTLYEAKVTNGSVTVIDEDKPTESTEGSTDNTQGGDVVYGDVDCNGKVELLDVILLNKNLLGMEKLSDKGSKNANVNNDNAVDGTDSLFILKSLVSLVTLPVQG